MRGTRWSGVGGRDMYSHHHANHSKILLEVPYSSVDEISGPGLVFFSMGRSGMQSR